MIDFLSGDKSNMRRMQKDPDMLEEYDFSKGIQGKYTNRYAEGANVVVIEPDVAQVFPDHDSVNRALRSLIEIIRQQKKLVIPPVTVKQRVGFDLKEKQARYRKGKRVKGS
jgi:hypothetical protein